MPPGLTFWPPTTQTGGGGTGVNRRIFFGIVLTWTLLEGAKGLWKVWARQREGSGGFLGAVADDVLEVVD